MTNERENLRNIIVQWNANRLDLFALTEPNEELEFHGVMRYYFQDSGQKVATKCIRVASTATAKDVIQTLIEKFRPDIRMLSIPEYALYEIHENGEERKLLDEEKPLLVQLNWHKDDREGRFLLRRMDEKTFLPKYDPEANGFKRKLSKREKKEKKKKEKLERLKIREEECENKDGIAEKLYSELPETSFTRSISNPEAVMRRRRQQKLEKKLQQFRQEGGPEGGGTLRVFGESLNKDVPYKTILVSMRDPATYVVREVLEKYALDGEDACQYCLVQMIIPGVGDMDIHDYHSSSIREYILDDDDCPLAIERQHNRNKGILAFHIRKRPADYQPRKRKKKSKQVKGEVEGGRYDDSIERLPVLLELHPDGSDVPQSTAKKHRLFLNVTEVGSERSSSTSGQYLQLFGPNVQSRHCVIAHTEGIVTVTPSSRDAETYVNGVRIYETTILQHGGVVRFGKLHTFRFIDPLHDESRRLSPDQRQVDYTERLKEESQHHNSYETTFDADGNVETVSTHSRDDRMSRKSDDAHSHRSFGREGAQSRNELRRGNDPILPAVLEFWEDGEDAFLNSVIGQVDASQVQFKLAPTYVLYMTARYRASTHYRPDSSPSDRAHRLTALMIKISGMVHQVIQDRYRDGTSLAFWLANSSELLHFLKQDRHLCAYTLDTQDLLAESVQLAFRSLVTCQQAELHAVMPAILEDRDDLNEEEGTTGEVLVVLSAAMSLLRRCRVNAALTIQMFSQLFHYINMWLFNRVVCETVANYCTRLWGVRLKRRLARVELWAEKQGLELAADCHLSRIIQAARLLQSPKSSPEDIASISSACFKLNSLQLRTLFERYQPQPDEPLIPRDLIDTVVKVAANTADELAHSDGRDVRLEEDTDLQLPFLLPEDGYSCDIVRGVPAGLQEFLQPLLQTGLSRLTIQPTSSGYWTIYMSDQDVLRATQGARSPSLQSHQGDGEVSGRGSAALPNEPEVAIIKLQKSNNGMGLSIVAARGVGQDKLGIYIKSVVKGGAADQDGRLQAGDQLLKVDGQSLVGISQEKAAELMTRTGQVVTLEIAKQGAIYHGLAALLSQPSPVMQRGGNQNGHRHTSERDIPSRVLQDQNHVLPSRIQGSKSVPSLNSNNNNSAPEPNGRNHEVYNPGYSRTSSNTSIPKAMDYPGPDGQAPRLKMGQEIHYDPRFQYPNRPGPPVNGTMVNVRQPPVPQHQPQVQVEERHYQNISMYQPQHYHPSSRPSPQPYPQQAVQRQIHGSHSSLLRPDHQQPAPQSPMDRSRPMSTLVSPREQEQYVNAMNYNNNRSATSPVPPSSPHRVQPPVQMGFVPRDVMDSDPRLPMDGPPEHHPSGKMHPPSYGGQIDPRHRDILRQEAKMEEMREEVRRREERSQHPSVNNRGPIWQPGRPVPPSGTLTRQPYPPPQQPQSMQQYPIRAIGPPVTAPKPRPSGQRSQQGYEINDPQVYGDTPPPPPPPSSTHPLLQTSLPAPAVSYRYGPSGYPPRSSDGGLEPRAPHPNSARMEANRLHQRMAPNQSGNQPRMAPDMANTQDNKKEFSITSPSPWEREEKEKLQKQRVEDARQARDDEIRDLENTTYRTPKQEERLRTLRLEQEFQRRAEEMRAEEDDDEDEDLLERAENRERTLRMQEDLERARQRRLEWEQEQQMKQQQDDWVRRRNNNNPPEAPERGVPQHVLQEQEGRLRQLRLEEGNRRKELEATKEAEDRLLKEARRRQEEEYRMHQQQLEQQRHMNSMHPPDLPPALPTSPPPIEPPHNHHQSYPPTGTQRLDNLVMHHGGYGSAPPPPERKSSYEVGNRPLPGSALRNGDIHQHPSNAPAPKKVSFHDSRLETEIGPTDRRNSASSNHSYTLEDIDSVLETPPPGHNNSTLINNNSISPTSTPGVIGAQEIYRDPRKRIEAERSYLQQSSRKPGPEQLSFREKMKMFALETGQDETPKDKVKISRAQRDIESRPNGPMAT